MKSVQPPRIQRNIQIFAVLGESSSATCQGFPVRNLDAQIDSIERTIHVCFRRASFVVLRGVVSVRRWPADPPPSTLWGAAVVAQSNYWLAFQGIRVCNHQEVDTRIVAKVSGLLSSHFEAQIDWRCARRSTSTAPHIRMAQHALPNTYPGFAHSSIAGQL
ncbi:hypothetical protein IQ06DRAFT_139437 [Phaeosphaeriaceae sp. SRC1lsM3a]|nr:hypothetical protein IQ06DRAFT_139437 [Stagonospora sp. SRC1lsM3a]